MNKLKKHSDKFYIQQVNAESLELIPNTKKDLEQDFVSLILKSIMEQECDDVAFKEVNNWCF